nr:hypothetical protein BaRGS_017875 [Batillaria attramentaria]
MYRSYRGVNSRERVPRPFRARYSTARRRRLEEEEKELNDTEANNRVAEVEVEKLEVLTVKDLDLHIKDNAKKHRTSRYHCVTTKDNQPVLRRGQEFELTLTFNRKYQKDKDDLHLMLEAEM